MDATAQAYSDAFAKANGYRPTVSANGTRYSVTTRAGSLADYTKRDLANLTRGLLRMADR